MKRLLLSISFLIGFLSMSVAQTAPAFPGAEGHGRHVAGGRKGTVYRVTSLSDDEKDGSGTAGSLRYCLKKGGNNRKTIVFEVGGVIALNKALNIPANTTIAGQTAPYPGITLRYYTVNPDGNEIIIRFIRFRRGQEKDVNDGADASTARHYTNIIFDHCSFSWSIDEVASFYDNNNFTMQWCTLGESLNNAGHGKGAHGYGGIWGGKLASFHHNMICHVNNRSPRFNGARYDWTGYTGNKLYSTYNWENAVQAENVDFRNCVIYNANGCYGGPGGGQINMVGNYYKSGPAATVDRLTTVTVGAEGNAEGYPKYWTMTSRYYVEGNIVEGNADINNDNFGKGFRYDDGVYTINGEKCSLDENNYYGNAVEHVQNSAGKSCVKIRMTEPADAGTVTTHTAQKAFEKVLAYGGASLHRDTVDARYMKEAQTGTATYKGSVTGKFGRIDKVSDVKGYTESDFPTGSRPEGWDTDGDGMPDAWETANGLHPNNASDALSFTLDPMKYYSNIEVYLNSLVQDIMIGGNADATNDTKDYYPAYKKEDGTQVEAINYDASSIDSKEFSAVLSQSTNLGNNTSSTYYFDDGVTITNTRSKNYATGSNDGIKFSAGVQYSINPPNDVTISQITFSGYDNYTDADAYLGEVAGTTYDATSYVFPKSKESVAHTIDFSPAISGPITFTPQGKQLVLSIALKGHADGQSSSVSATIDSHPIISTECYTLQGTRIHEPRQGAYILSALHADGSRKSHKVFVR